MPGTKPHSRPVLSENLALLARPRPRSTLLLVRGEPIHCSEAEWSGTRLLTGDTKVRFLPLQQLELDALTARDLPARVLRVRSCPCFSMVEDPLRTRRQSGSTPGVGSQTCPSEEALHANRECWFESNQPDYDGL